MPLSTGCQQCKARRIKCDETKPVCLKCAKSRRICNGARQSFSLVHAENVYASGQKKRPRGPRSNPATVTANTLDLILPKSPVDLRTQAVVYYVNRHLQRLEDAPTLLRSISGDILPLWKSRDECQILDLAISSIALAVFSKTQRYPPAAVEASSKYQTLLKILRLMLPAIDQSNIDTCLLAITFMGLYEDAIHQPALDTTIPFVLTLKHSAHQDGASAMLKFWKEHLSPELPATNVIKHARRSVMKSSLLRGLALPEWIREGASFGERGLELEYDRLIVRIISVRQRLFALLKQHAGLQTNPTEVVSTAKILNEEAQDIDRALEIWTTHFPSKWCLQQHTLSNPDLPKECFYSPIVYSHQNVLHAAVWIRYYSSRLLINSSRQRIFRLIEINQGIFSHEQRSDCLSNINVMTDDLARTIPFCLERFKVAKDTDSSRQIITLITQEDIKPYLASMTISSLAIAAGLSHVDIEQKRWFKSQLVGLGQVMGSGMFESASDEHWLEL